MRLPLWTCGAVVVVELAGGGTTLEAPFVSVAAGLLLAAAVLMACLQSGCSALLVNH